MKLSIKKLLIFTYLFFISNAIPVAYNAKKPQVQIRTIAGAISYLRKAMNDFPADRATVPVYEKQYADIIIKCAKILYDNARNQILEALLEIDNRIAYWQYQKDHPWNYFVSKNPLKWVAGPKQEDEVENNLDVLKSHQGELYVLLGQLSELGISFTRGYKDIFLVDYQKGYEWIDKLLDALVRIKIKAHSETNIPFIARVQRLQSKFERVNQFKKDLVSDIAETEIPSYLTRNWFKSGAVLLGLSSYGYKNFYDNIASALMYGGEKSSEYIFDPVAATFKDVFYAGQGRGINVGVLSRTRNVALGLTEEFVHDKGEKYKISKEDQQKIIEGLKNENYEGYQKFLNTIANQEHLESEKSEWQVMQLYQKVKSGLAQLPDLSDYFQGKIHFYDLFAFNLIAEQQRQYAAVGKLVLLIPAVLASGAMYAGYQKLTEKSYGSLRRALVDINSLFVDPSKPLTDEQYGKMIYLIYMLKKHAEKELSTKKNVRADFIHDLERIESSEFNVAAKRAIIEDMFKKYSFLGFIQQK